MKIGGLVLSGELYRDKSARIGGAGKGMIERFMDIQSRSLHTNHHRSVIGIPVNPSLRSQSQTM